MERQPQGLARAGLLLPPASAHAERRAPRSGEGDGSNTERADHHQESGMQLVPLAGAPTSGPLEVAGSSSLALADKWPTTALAPAVPLRLRPADDELQHRPSKRHCALLGAEAGSVGCSSDAALEPLNKPSFELHAVTVYYPRSSVPIHGWFQPCRCCRSWTSFDAPTVDGSGSVPLCRRCMARLLSAATKDQPQQQLPPPHQPPQQQQQQQRQGHGSPYMALSTSDDGSSPSCSSRVSFASLEGLPHDHPLPFSTLRHSSGATQ